MKNNRTNVYRIAVVGIMAAMVFAATNIRYPIPTPLGNTQLHLGNVMCLLSGILFGPVPGGLAAGIGSFFFDLFSEYASEAPITFINKFAMGFVAGLIASPKNGVYSRAKRIVGAISGAVTYVILYITKNIVTQYFILKVEWPTVVAGVTVKGITSLVNALIAVVASLLLAEALIPTLKRMGLLDKVRGKPKTDNGASAAL